MSVIPACMPASPAQELLLRFADARLDSSLLWAHRTVRLRGPVDLAALREAAAGLVANHGALTCALRVDERGALWQDLGSATAPELIAVQVAADPPVSVPEPDDTGATSIRQPIRLALYPAGADDHLLRVDVHRLACDDWSFTLLMTELAERYTCALPGGPPIRDNPAVDHAAAIRRQAEVFDRVGEEQTSYWASRLAGAPQRSAFDATEGPSPDPGETFHITLDLDASLSADLTRLAQSTRATSHMVLIAASQLVLGRRLGEQDVVVAAVASGRRPEWERVIGRFAAGLAVRTDLSGTPSFSTLVTRVRAALVDASRHQDLPFDVAAAATVDMVVEPPQPLRPPLRWGSCLAEPTAPDSLGTEHPATLRTVTGADGWRLALTCRGDRFARDDAEAFLAQLGLVLAQAAANPDGVADQFSLVPVEHRGVLPDPREPMPEPRTRCVTSMVAQQVVLAPEATAVEHAGRTWSYRDLWQGSERLVAALTSAGVGPGQVVAVRGSGFGLVVAMLGVLRSGGVLMPVGLTTPLRRQARLIEIGRPALMLCADGDETPVGIQEDVLRIDPVTGARPDDGGRLTSPAAAAATEAAKHDDAADEPAYLCFTSGTSGEPQPVIGTHKGLGNFLAWQSETFQIGPGDRAAQLTELSFDVVLRDIFCPLVSGATLCMPERRGGRLPGSPFAWMAAHRVTMAHLVPTVAAAWLADLSHGQVVPQLRIAFFAGEPLHDHGVRRFRGHFPAAEVINLYGPSETTLATYWFRVPQNPLPGVQPVGWPLPGARALVYSGPQDRECGIGEIGEIVMRTTFPTGTLNQSVPGPSERFVPNRYTRNPADLVYRTGDRGRYRANGSLVVLGRIDDQVKIRGVRVDPREVAAELERHRGVTAVAVVPDQVAGQTALTAHIVRADSSVTASDLLNHLSVRLPAAMVPARLHFHDRLPATPNGKLDRLKLMEQTGLESVRSPAPAAEPLTAAECRLAQIWQELLPAAPAQPGRHESFFHLGGHSMLAMRMIGIVSDEFDVDVPLNAFFDSPTIAGISRLLTEDAR